MRAMKEDLTGRQFGDLLVVGRSSKQRGTGFPYWTCRCACSRTVDLLTANLKRMFSCGCKRTQLIAAARTKTPGNPAKNRLIRHYQLAAKQRGFVFELTDSQCAGLFVQDCHYCGSPPLQTISSRAHTYMYNGIDRRDSDRGYVVDNVLPSCGACNRMKMELPYEQFLDLVRRIYEHRVA